MRRETPDGRRAVIAARFSDAELAAIDAARGDLAASTWLHDAAVAALAGEAPAPPVPAVRGEAAPRAARKTAGRCTHRPVCVKGGWCRICGGQVMPGGAVA